MNGDYGKIEFILTGRDNNKENNMKRLYDNQERYLRRAAKPLLLCLACLYLAVICFVSLTNDAAASQSNDRTAKYPYPYTLSNYEHMLRHFNEPGPIIGPPQTDIPFFSGDAAGLGNNSAIETLCAGEGYLIERMVTCVTSIVEGATETFLESFTALLFTTQLALIVLAVTIFGGKIIAGQVRKPGAETSLLALKIGAIFVFTAPALGGFMTNAFGIMEELATYTTEFLNSAGVISGCADAGSLWAKLDCLVITIITGGPDDENSALFALFGALTFSHFFGFLVW